jgi:hypothetical protein
VSTFKHAALHSQLPAECPPKQSKEADRTAFRYVWKPIDAKSFYIFAPKLGNRFGKKGTCSDCALSMFETEEQARLYFATVKESHPQIGQKIGDHLAKIALIKAHGVQTTPEDDGHFDLHEYGGVDLVPVAQLIGPL